MSFTAPARAPATLSSRPTAHGCWAQPPGDRKLPDFGSRTFCPRVLPGSFQDQIQPWPPQEKDVGRTCIFYSKSCLKRIPQKFGSRSFLGGWGCAKMCYVHKLSSNWSRKERKGGRGRRREGGLVTPLWQSPTHTAPLLTGLGLGSEMRGRSMGN